MYEKVDERTAVAKYGVTPRSVDTNKAFEEGPMQVRSRMAAREFNHGDRVVLQAGTQLEVLKAIPSLAANH